MKKFKFKLEALLKLREFKEDKCKIEMGKIQKHIAACESQIEREKNEINEAYIAQRKMLERGMAGRETQFIPTLVRGKEAKIVLLKKEIERKKIELQEKQAELIMLRADVKVMTKLKEKEQKAFKHAMMKKDDMAREELVNIWHHHKKSKEL
ncbi:MAG: flagellar FliJ family protein [Bacteriovoracaceae bacterium]|nr:flagellar FliJ family protein [Bacteriovoracaceae bacterium]